MYYVYILASRKHGTLYIGVTNDLVRRVYQHKTDAAPGFTSRYGIHMLVWFECYDDVRNAITREKELKKWRREWKINLIEPIRNGLISMRGSQARPVVMDSGLAPLARPGMTAKKLAPGNGHSGARRNDDAEGPRPGHISHWRQRA